MKYDDPILLKIREKQKKIVSETQLIKKKYTANLFIVTTSFIIFIGILVGIIRILMVI